MDSYPEEYCKECGKPIQYQTLSCLGLNKLIRIDCECEEKKRQEQEALKAERKHRECVERLRQFSGMPLEQQECLLSEFIPRAGTEKHLNACLAYTDKFDEYCKQGRGILFTGSTGSGKTHLASGIANELIEREIPVKFEVVPELLQKIQATYSSFAESEDSVISPLKKCRLLILDELGGEKPSEWTMTILHNIINYRYINYKPTIITTNLTTSELGNVLGARTVDRILDKNKPRFYALTMAASSYRRG